MTRWQLAQMELAHPSKKEEIARAGTKCKYRNDIRNSILIIQSTQRFFMTFLLSTSDSFGLATQNWLISKMQDITWNDNDNFEKEYIGWIWNQYYDLLLQVVICTLPFQRFIYSMSNFSRFVKMHRHSLWESWIDISLREILGLV